jgi:siderophore-iron reductase FhuF
MQYVREMSDGAEEIAGVFNLHISRSPGIEPPMRLVAGSTLLQREVLEQVFAALPEIRKLGGEEQQAVLPAAKASQFSKYYCRALCGALFAMSVLQRAVHVELDAIAIGLDPSRELGPSVVTSGALGEAQPTRPQRNCWRDAILHHLFARNIGPLFQALTNHYHLNPILLWENCVIYIHYFYQKWIREAADADKVIIEDDYRYLIELAAPDLFGVRRGQGNPLQIQGTYVPHPDDPDELLRIRKTCCLRNRLPNAKACSTCPQPHVRLH